MIGGEYVKYVNKEFPKYLLMPINSPFNKASPGCFFCCFDYGIDPFPLYFCKFGENREDYLKNLESLRDCFTKFGRIGLFIMHFAAYYFILYPFILLLGMIPFIGAITSFVLIFFAFLISLISYFMILIIAWIFSRPIYAIFLIIMNIGLITVIFLLRKTEDDHSKWGYRIINITINNDYHNINNIGNNIENTKFLKI